MTKAFLRPLEAADRGKAWEAEQVLGATLPLFRQIVGAPDLALRLDGTTAGTLYVGLAEPGTADSSPFWKIKKVLTEGSSTSILWAEGTSSFQHIWANRATLAYS